MKKAQWKVGLVPVYLYHIDEEQHPVVRNRVIKDGYVAGIVDMQGWVKEGVPFGLTQYYYGKTTNKWSVTHLPTGHLFHPSEFRSRIKLQNALDTITSLADWNHTNVFLFRSHKDTAYRILEAL